MELRQCLSALGRLKRVNNEIEKPNNSKKIMIKLFNKTYLSIAALFCAMFLLAACSSEEITPTTPGGNVSKVLTTFVAGTPATNDTPTTSSSRRTSMDYATGNFFWEEGDRIFVKDDNGQWQRSSNAVDAAHAHSAAFEFKVPGTFTASNTYKIYYAGKNGTNDQVSISTAQTQTSPNTTVHIGDAGDCGIADATRRGTTNEFDFRLNHQAAVLVFQPYTTNAVLQRCTLTKIEVLAEDEVAGTYTLNPATNSLTGNGNSKTIVLTTKGTGAYANGFLLTNTTPDRSLNGAFMVIKPGTHRLKVRFWLKDNVDNIEGTITKRFPSFNYAANTYYDLSANLKLKEYGARDYSMWDAKEPYWSGHEWDSTDPWQPTMNGESHSGQPIPSDRLRWYADAGINKIAPKTDRFKATPNVNLMRWYAEKGNPHWDSDELWFSMGHLRKGGLWLKKKAVIAAENSTTEAAMSAAAPDGTNYDVLTTDHPYQKNSIDKSVLSASETANYFYLPAAGDYIASSPSFPAKLESVGSSGYYWTSTSVSYYSYCLQFFTNNNGTISLKIAKISRTYGILPWPFE